MLSKIDSPGLQKERRERFLIRKQYFEENLSQLGSMPRLSEKAAEITRTSLEEEARQGSLRDTTPEIKFWQRQRSWRESAAIAKDLIDRAQNETVVETKKEL